MQWYILQYALENKVDYEDLMLFFAYLKLFFFEITFTFLTNIAKMAFCAQNRQFLKLFI